jgi:hypothetical protein
MKFTSTRREEKRREEKRREEKRREETRENLTSKYTYFSLIVRNY